MMCYVKLAGPEQDILHASLVILQCIGREDEGEREGMGRLCWQLVERFLSDRNYAMQEGGAVYNNNNSD